MRMPARTFGEDAGLGVQVLPVAPEASAVPAPLQAPVGAEDLGADAEAWLHAQPGTTAPVLWCPSGTVENALRGADELAAKVARLASEGSWAVVRRAHGATWAQCMRVDGGWIVEVNGVPGPDCYVRRVSAGGARGRRGRRYARDHGRLMAIYQPRDVVSTPGAVAEIIWAWLRGGLVEGFTLREIDR